MNQHTQPPQRFDQMDQIDLGSSILRHQRPRVPDRQSSKSDQELLSQMFEFMILKFGTLETSISQMTQEVKKNSDKVKRLDAKLDKVSEVIQKQPLQAPQIQDPEPMIMPE